MSGRIQCICRMQRHRVNLLRRHRLPSGFPSASADISDIGDGRIGIDNRKKLLPESVAHIERDFGPKVLVFGRKSFGHIDLKQLLAEPAEAHPHLANDLAEKHIRTNHLLRATLGDSHYIDVTRLLCDSDTSCHLFTADGKLISYEGMHLTLDGAKYFGARLLTQPLISGANGSARTDATVHRITERP